MAFTATLTNITRQDQTLDVEVRYADSASGFTLLRVLNFHGIETLSLATVVAEVRRIGGIYKAALATEASLVSHVGDSITIA